MMRGKHISTAGWLTLLLLAGCVLPAAGQAKKDLYNSGEAAAMAGRIEESQKCYCQVAKMDPGYKDAKMMCSVMTEELQKEKKKNEARFNLGVQQFNAKKYDEAQHEFANIRWGQYLEEARQYLDIKIPQARKGGKK
jgi:tetratricopeptide (TPR) repeat protein